MQRFGVNTSFLPHVLRASQPIPQVIPYNSLLIPPSYHK